MADNLSQLNRQPEEWVSKLRYSRSFMAKLLLSEPETKEYYAALTTRLLSYDKIRSRLSWSGVRYSAGKKVIAKIVFGGKTLNVFFALDAADYSEGRYKLKRPF